MAVGILVEEQHENMVEYVDDGIAGHMELYNALNYLHLSEENEQDHIY